MRVLPDAVRLEDDAEAIPATALFDFAAAFPSLAQAWLWEVLQRMLTPSGLLAFLQAVQCLQLQSDELCSG